MGYQLVRIHLAKEESMLRGNRRIFTRCLYTHSGARSSSVEELEKVVQFIRGNKVLVLTGAGISTESGIPDYRSPNGAYSKVSNYLDVSSTTYLYRG